jgi:hypothetical protein
VKKTPRQKYLTRLRQTLATRLDDSELRTLCFDLGIDYADLPGEGRADKARELIAYLDRRDRIPDLLSVGHQLRPDILWPQTYLDDRMDMLRARRDEEPKLAEATDAKSDRRKFVISVIAVIVAIFSLIADYGGWLFPREPPVTQPSVPTSTQALLSTSTAQYQSTIATRILPTTTLVEGPPEASETKSPTAISSRPVPQPAHYRVLIDTYHSPSLLGSTHKQHLKKSGFEFETATGPFTAEQLASYDILMIDLAWYHDQTEEFTDEELALVREYIDRGGSAFLTGIGWVWVQYGHRPIEEYPLNIIAEEYGIWFAEDYVCNVKDNASPVFYAPFMNMEHPITRNVRRIAHPGAVPSSLIVEPPSVPIVWGDDNTTGFWNNKNPIVLAAASVEESRIVCLQHGGYVQSLLDEYDNLRLLENILVWLVTK